MRGGDRERAPILDYRLMTGNPHLRPPRITFAPEGAETGVGRGIEPHSPRGLEIPLDAPCDTQLCAALSPPVTVRFCMPCGPRQTVCGSNCPSDALSRETLPNLIYRASTQIWRPDVGDDPQRQ